MALRELNTPQAVAVQRVYGELGATAYTVEWDEPHDAHAFVQFFTPDGVVEKVIEGDGRIEG